MKCLIQVLYKDCHKLLGYLDKISNIRSKEQIHRTKVLSKKVDIPFERICKAVILLEQNKHITIGTNVIDDFCWLDYDSLTGRNAFYSEYYLETGYEKWKTNALRWIQKIGILTATIATIISFVINIGATKLNSRNIQQVTQKVILLEVQISSLKDSLRLYQGKNKGLVSVKKQ